MFSTLSTPLNVLGDTRRTTETRNKRHRSTRTTVHFFKILILYYLILSMFKSILYRLELELMDVFSDVTTPENSEDDEEAAEVIL